VKIVMRHGCIFDENGEMIARGRGFPENSAEGIREIDGVDWVDPLKQGGRRTKHSDPYSYSDFYIWRSFTDEEYEAGGISADYHDRMQQWDYKKYQSCFPKRSGITSMRSRTASKFLSDYFGKTITCVGISEGCNVSSGYPYWVFYYKVAEAEKPKEEKSK
jgi:hypothetical protein